MQLLTTFDKAESAQRRDNVESRPARPIHSLIKEFWELKLLVWGLFAILVAYWISYAYARQ